MPRFTGIVFHMSALKQSSVQNRLLALLPLSDFDQIASDLEYLPLPQGLQLVRSGQMITHIYFLCSGIASVMVVTPEGNSVEGGIFGLEGYVPPGAVAGARTSPFDINMQVEGDGYRMPYDVFRRWTEENRNFERVATRSVESFLIQLAYTAASNALHDVNVRLARWILMCHDRIAGNEIALTHEFISTMLAVRRPSVTTALHVLEGHGFIRSTRGMIAVRDRAALEQFAHDSYGRPEQEYRQLMGSLF